jgi:putative membrane-bound dehydrogenase-like protein
MTKARARRVLPALLIALAAGWPSTAKGGLPKVPDDFEVRLVANVPSFLYACQVAAAPDGALYVAVDPMDQVGPYESNDGQIYVYREGKDPVLFAEGFRAIFGMAWHDGALYVSHMPYLSVVRDTDGDGKADDRKDLFKDLGITKNRGLNDHIVSGIQFGIDNRLYISTGDKGVLKATGPDGKTAQVVGGGTLRCKPDGTEIEVVSTGTRNHLEPNLDDRDNLFTYDNTDDGDGWWTRVTHHVDGGYYGYPYDYHEHPDRFLNRIAEFGGGSPCGGVVYKEDAWPEKYRNRVFWSEWGKKKIQGFAFEPSGASFKIKDTVDFVEPGDSGEFRPLDVCLSYDGKTMYIADWGMGSWGSKTEKVGRVYAVTYKGPAIATRPRGQDSDPLEAQFKQLDHPSWNERMRAQVAIIKAGKPAVDQAARMLLDEKVDPVARRHLVWIENAIDPDYIPLALACESKIDDVRAQAIRAIGQGRHQLLATHVTTFLKDPSPAVRLQAVIALGRIGDPNQVTSLLPLLTDPDRYIAFSTRQAIRRCRAGHFSNLASHLRDGDEKLRAAILATLELVYDKEAVDLLRQVLGTSAAPEAERAKALTELALVARKAPEWDGKWWGTRPTQGKPPAKTIAWESTPDILKTIESSLADPSVAVRIAAVSAVRTTDDRAALPAVRERFKVEKEPKVRQEVALALGQMGDKEALPLLIAALRDPSNPEGVRSAALSGLETIGGKPAVEALIEALTNKEGSLKEEVQARMVAALGRFKAKEAIPAIADRLSHASAEVRVAAADALGKIGDAKLGAPKVRPALNDKAPEVRKAALNALAALKDVESIPAMIELANDEPTRYEGTLALAKLPDVRALQVYLRGLADRSPDLRKASASAIVSIRDKAEPVLEQLSTRRELAPAALPELRKIYNQLQPVEGWHVMGPFPFNDRPPVRTNVAVDLAATAPGPEDTTLAWKPISVEGEHGMVDLAKFYGGKGDCSAFGTAVLESPVARPAQMAVGSDDTLTVWLNGKEVYKFNDSRGYEPEVARFDVELKKGKNLLLIKCGNGGGPWQYSVAVTGLADYAFLKGPSTGGFDPDKFKAAALKGDGQAARGKALFADLKGLACSKCHVVGGEGGNIGPDLSGIGARYPREELIASVLYPSARIFSGYESAVVATADGRVLTGLIKSDNADGLEIQDAEGKRTKVAKADIEDRKTSDLSLMPNGIVEGITERDFADLIGYLETLKDASANQAKPGGL